MVEAVALERAAEEGPLAGRVRAEVAAIRLLSRAGKDLTRVRWCLPYTTFPITYHHRSLCPRSLTRPCRRPLKGAVRSPTGRLTTDS